MSVHHMSVYHMYVYVPHVMYVCNMSAWWPQTAKEPSDLMEPL